MARRSKAETRSDLDSQARETISAQGSSPAVHDIPALIQDLADKDKNPRVYDALRKLGAAAVPYLLPAVDDPKPKIQCEVAQLFRELQDIAKGFVPQITSALEKMMQGEDSDARYEAAVTLVRYDHASAVAADTLADLTVRGGKYREKAATRLARMEPTVAVPKLRSLLQGAEEGSVEYKLIQKHLEQITLKRDIDTSEIAQPAEGPVKPVTKKPSGQEQNREDDDEQALPPISLDEISQARAEVEKFQTTVVERFQRLLDALAGRRAESEEVNKAIAKQLYSIARSAGIELFYDTQPTHIRWTSGVFQLRTTDATRRFISSSATFPPLTAGARHYGRDSEPESPDSTNVRVQDVQRQRSGRSAPPTH